MYGKDYTIFESVYSQMAFQYLEVISLSVEFVLGNVEKVCVAFFSQINPVLILEQIY